MGGKLDVDDLNLEPQDDYIIEKEDKSVKWSNETDDSIDGALVFDDLPTVDLDQGTSDEIPEDVFN